MRELECNRALLTTALISGADALCLHSSHRRTVLIFGVTQISKKTLLTVIN